MARKPGRGSPRTVCSYSSNYNDDLFNCAFISWDNFDLWNAWLRVFGLGTFRAEFHLMNSMSD
ncbi:MAG: hypothetical protein H0X34_04295 [Chthoniobacterales bacterium]|nr:hypothetical protein [Chthoniobacterales bacterium]